MINNSFFARPSSNRKIKYDIIIMSLIVLLPFIFYTYNLAPKTAKWQTDWFEIDSGIHEDVNFYLWIISVKLLTIMILSIWFLTCDYWWRYVLFIPISLEIYKILINIKVTNFGYNNQPQFIESLIYAIPFIILLLLVDKLTGYYYKNNAINFLINQEINNQLIRLSKFDARNYKEVKRELSLLNKEKNNLGNKGYLIKLIALRDRLSS